MGEPDVDSRLILRWIFRKQLDWTVKSHIITANIDTMGIYYFFSCKSVEQKGMYVSEDGKTKTFT